MYVDEKEKFQTSENESTLIAENKSATAKSSAT